MRKALDLDAAALRLSRLVEELQKPKPLDTVRGHEGDGARVYFDVFDHLVTESKEAFFFRARSRRPPLDNLNASAFVPVHALDARCCCGT